MNKYHFSTLCRIRVLFAAMICVCLMSVCSEAKLTDETVEIYRLRGYEAQQKGDIQGVLDNYSKAVLLGINDPEVFNELAILFEDKGSLQRAEQLYQQALGIDADYLPAYMNLAYLYISQGKANKAIPYLKERFERSSVGDPWREKAAEELKKINPSFRTWIANHEVKSFQDEIIREKYEDFIRQVESAQKYYEQGLSFLESRDYKSAIQQFDQSLSLTPRNKKVEDARQKAVLEMLKESVRQRSEHAISLLEAGDAHSAKGEFQKILTSIPRDTVTH